jgi:hypothetical protein
LVNGLVNALRERSITLRTMDPLLRWATGLTGAGIVLAAILLLVRELPLGSVAIGSFDNEQVTLSEPLFVGSIGLLAVGCGFLVAGALFARAVFAVITVLLVVLFVGWQTGVLGIAGLSALLPDWALWTTRALLLGVVAVAVVTLVARRGLPAGDPRDRVLRTSVTVIVPTLFISYFIVLSIASPVLNGLTLFPMSVGILMQAVSFFATPMLMITAIDFGQWGELAGERLAAIRLPRRAAAGARRHTEIAAAALCVVAVIVGMMIGTGTVIDRFGYLLQSVVLLAVVLAVLLSLGRLLRIPGSGRRVAPGFASLFVVCAVLTWIVTGATGLVAGVFQSATELPPVSEHGDYTSTANVRTITGVSGASALVPVGWGVTADSAGTIDVLRTVLSDTTRGTLLITRAAGDATIDGMLQATQSSAVGSAVADGAWQLQSITAHDGSAGRIWLGSASDPRSAGLVVVATAAGPDPDAAFRQFEAVVRTTRPSGIAPVTLPEILTENGNAHPPAAEAPDPDLVPAVGAGFTALVGAFAILLLLAVRRRRPSWRPGLLYAGVVGAIAVAAASDSIGRELFGQSSWWPILTIGGVVAATGVLGGAALLVGRWTRARWAARLPIPLLGLVGAVILLGVLNRLYSVALDAATAPVWAAVLILVAVGWDLAMSGESMTNRSTPAFPRSTRVVAFCGYLLVLVSAIVFFAGQLSAATGGPVADSYFEPESVTQAALFRIALPVFILIFLLRVAQPDPTAASSPAIAVAPAGEADQLKSASGPVP